MTIMLHFIFKHTFCNNVHSKKMKYIIYKYKVFNFYNCFISNKLGSISKLGELFNVAFILITNLNSKLSSTFLYLQFQENFLVRKLMDFSKKVQLSLRLICR